jgi:raffinose/stachyose/melibiose transport system substrate-binding protein
MSKRISVLLAVLVVFAGLAGAQAKAKTISFLSIWPEANDNSKLILDLTKEYQATHPNFKLDFELVDTNSLQQKVKVLLASDDLPDVFAYESGTPILELIEAGKIVDIEKAFKDLGISEYLDAGAVSLLKRLASNKGLYDLPLGMNIEGLWYNKADFTKAGIKAPPATWDELMTDCEKLKKVGIQPFTAGGKDKWPLSRVLNMYVMRKLGVDAMEKGVAGKISFSDPAFIESAKVVQDMAKKGYFGTGITTVDYATAADTLFSGKAAMLYNGSWFAENLNDSKRNVAGPEGIGFFNIPLVKGGAGKMDDYSMNCGTILCLSKAKYDAATADWVKYVFTRMGDKAMKDYGAVKGYKVTNAKTDLPGYTKLIQAELKKAKTAGLWFEANFDSKTSQVAQDNIQALFLGMITPEQYWKDIDSANKEYQASK